MVSSSGATTASQNRGLASRIIGGWEANRKRFPYYTYLKLETAYGQAWWCGGSLIARDVVLTAAHCLYPEFSNDTFAAVDVWVNSSSTKYSDYEHYRQGTRLVVHPGYKGRITNDIGLIFLDELVKGVPRVKLNRDASIPVSKNPPALTAIGLGVSGINTTDNGLFSETTYTRPKALMQVAIKPVSTLACKKVYGSATLGESAFCAGGDGVTGTCFGDSGGPLLLKSTSAKNDVQVGISIAVPSANCVEVDEPDIFTRVAYYADWIDAQICKYSMDKQLKPATCPKANRQLRAAATHLLKQQGK